MTELIGQHLGQYEVMAEIGKGGMATVYRATQRSMGREVAIKVLPRSLTHETNFLQRFYREVEIIARLQHPHILPVYDFGTHDEMPYIVMALLTGGTLADVIMQGAMEPRTTVRVVNQMADALEYAHSKGIIHRDFKPSNVLLDEQGNTYLADFGLAKMSESSSAITGTGILGTPTYMAPEQSEPGELTSSADIYALGVTVFQMLTGSVPYEAPTPLGVLLAHVTQPVPQISRLRADLAPSVQVVIDRSMAKSPSARFATPRALADALAEALEGRAPASSAAAPEVMDALLMTNMLGQVIFVDSPFLKLVKRHHSDARNIIGKPLYGVLGIPQSQVDNLIKEVSKSGRVEGMRMEIRDTQGKTITVMCSAVATKDDKNTFVGADVTLRPISDVIITSGDFQTMDKHLDTREETFLQTYFTAQMEALRDLVIQLGGKRLGTNLEKIINETAQRNVWPVSMENGKVSVQMRNTEADAYRALLAKAVTYAVSLVGKRMVSKEMEAVDKKIDARVLELVKQLHMRDVFADLM
jgi:serine/threonine-protein kinase